MGAGSSIKSGSVLTKDDAKAFAGDLWDEVQWEAAEKDNEGRVRAELLLEFGLYIVTRRLAQNGRLGNHEMKDLGFATDGEYDAFKDAGFEYFEAKLEGAKNSKAAERGDRVLHEGRLATVVYGPDEDGEFSVCYDDNGEESRWLHANELKVLSPHPARKAYDECIALGFTDKIEYHAFKTSREYKEMRRMGFSSDKTNFDEC